MELNSADFIQMYNEIKAREEKYGNRLYHYTSLNTFLCMMRTREIWMGSTGSMNDRKEITYYIELLEKELNSYCRQDFFEKVYNQIPFSYKYAFCLSTEKDDAAQWERYGDSAMGVCLSFNVGELCKCIYGYEHIMFNEVFYNDSVTEDKYLAIIKKYFEIGVIDVYSSEEELIRELIISGNLQKHKSFKNEHEIRITTVDNKSWHGTKCALKEIGNVIKKVYILEPDIMGNAKGTSFEKIIDEVIVGPRSQQNINILQQYVYSKGLYDLADRITMSECPLR